LKDVIFQKGRQAVKSFISFEEKAQIWKERCPTGRDGGGGHRGDRAAEMAEGLLQASYITVPIEITQCQRG